MTMKSNDQSVSPFGVVSAIANFYGMTSAGELLRRIDLKTPKAFIGYDSRLISDVLNHKTIKEDVHKLMPNINTDEIPNLTIYTRSEYSRHIKVCKSCIKENRLHQIDWQNSWKTHCERHNEALVDGCNHIYADASWEKELLCRHCITTPEKKRVPNYVSFCRSQNASFDEASFFSELMDLAEEMVRPLDFISVGIRWESLRNHEVIELFTNAFSLLSNPKTYKVWHEAIYKKRNKLDFLNQSVTEKQLDRIKASLSSQSALARNSAVSPLKILKHYHQTLEPLKYTTRFHILKNSSPDDVAMLIRQNVISEMLDIDYRVMPELVDLKILPAVKGSLRTDKLLFDAREINKVVARRFDKRTVVKKRAVYLSSIPEHILGALLLSYKKVSYHLLLGTLKAYLVTRPNVESSNTSAICPESLQSLFEYLLNTRSHLDHLSIKQMGNFLVTTKPCIEALIKVGLLSYARWHTSSLLIDIDSVKDFFEESVCLNREALLDGESVITRLGKVQACCGIAPDINQKAGKDPIPIVVYQKSRLNSCCLKIALNQLKAFDTVDSFNSRGVRVFTNSRVSGISY